MVPLGTLRNSNKHATSQYYTYRQRHSSPWQLLDCAGREAATPRSRNSNHNTTTTTTTNNNNNDNNDDDTTNNNNNNNNNNNDIIIIIIGPRAVSCLRGPARTLCTHEGSA